jgi:bacterioferritin-associated ferredoxin
MYICHCRAVTDRTIRQEVAAGARTIDELAERCQAGSRCGGCWPALMELLSQIEARQDTLVVGSSLDFPRPRPALAGQPA